MPDAFAKARVETVGATACRTAAELARLYELAQAGGPERDEGLLRCCRVH